jgi:hypothetical protein
MDENDIAAIKAAIKARWANATPGPWQVAFHGVYEVEAPPNQLVADVGICGSAKEDAEAIAAAPQDIATLLAALEERDAELARLREDAAGLGAAIDVSLPPLTGTPAAEVDRLRAELEAARREADDAREERDHWHAKAAHIGQALGMAAPESGDWRDVSADAVARRAEAARVVVEAAAAVDVECDGDCQPGIGVHRGRCGALVDAWVRYRAATASAGTSASSARDASDGRDP